MYRNIIHNVLFKKNNSTKAVFFKVFSVMIYKKQNEQTIYTVIWAILQIFLQRPLYKTSGNYCWVIVLTLAVYRFKNRTD